MPWTRWAAPLLAGLLTLSATVAAAQTTPPSTPTPAEQMPPAPPGDEPSPLPLQPGDAFGLEVMLPERTIVLTKGHANWDNAFETLVASFKTLHAYLDKAGIKPAGPAMTIYTQTDETGFAFEAAYPVAAAPANLPDAIAVGQAPAGKALKFVHRGAYDAMDTTYEAITNFLDDHALDAKDMFIEEYTTDPLVATPDRLVIDIFVPIK